jgi:hypothetical protein
MTSASSLAFPGSRTLAGWWRQLSPHHPTAIAVGHLFIHRVEAPVAVNRLQNVERLSRLLLEALEFEAGRVQNEQELLARLENRSHLDRTILHQMLRRLQSEGLVGLAPPPRPTELGRHALRYGHYAVEAGERRVFHFLERCDPQGSRIRPPQFLHFQALRGVPWHVNDAHPFDPVWLGECLAQTESWKQAWGFPMDVLRLPERTVAREASAWEHVIVDHPEQALAVLILAPGSAASRLLGFTARQEGWQLQATEPILVLDNGWEELFPELVPPTGESLSRAWQTWAQAHGLGEAESSACALKLTGQRLHVQAQPVVVERLRSVRGDSWLLLGEGYLRTGLQLELS